MIAYREKKGTLSQKGFLPDWGACPEKAKWCTLNFELRTYGSPLPSSGGAGGGSLTRAARIFRRRSAMA